MRNYWIFVIGLIVLTLDQFTKWLVRTSMYLYQSVPVIGRDFFRLTYIENEGIIFGMLFGGRIFLAFITVCAIIFLLFYIYKMKYAPAAPKIALGLILGGAFGNFADRLLRGRVVDFLDFDFPDCIVQRWPIFNLADSAVNVGMTILIVYLVFFDNKYKLKNINASAGLGIPHQKESVSAAAEQTPAEASNESGNRGNDHHRSGEAEEGKD